MKISYFSFVKTNRYDHISDAELLNLYHSDGNGEWIGILLKRYTLLLLGVCMKYLKNEEDAKDSVQQIFLKVLGEVSKYKIDYFKSWLYMVAKNHCLMKLRSRQGKNTSEFTDQIPHQSVEENKAQFLEDEKTYSFLEAALNELNEEQQQCVTLFYMQKQSYQQISDTTGYTSMQVKSFIQNGKRNLKLLLEKRMKQNNASGK